MVNKIVIDLKQVLLYSKLTVKSGKDAGKLVLARNLDCMKEWTDEEIDEKRDPFHRTIPMFIVIWLKVHDIIQLQL